MTRAIGHRQRLIGHPPSQAKIDRDLAVAALHAMQRSTAEGGPRPLRPPPTRFERFAETAAARALRADKRAGLL